MNTRLTQRIEIVNPTGGADPIVIEGPLKSSIADGGLGELISVILSVLYPLAGVILFFIILWGGFDLLTSKGEADKVKSAQGKLSSGIIGFVLLVLSFFVVRVVAYVFGLDNALF